MQSQADVTVNRDALRRLIAGRIEEVESRTARSFAELAQLRKDLKHLEAPGFGLCRECGVSIDFAHLLEDPGMRYCARCGHHFFWEQDRNFRFVLRVGSGGNTQPYPVEQVIGKTRWELPTLNLSAEDWAQHRADLEAHREFRDLLISRPTASGKPRWLCVTGRPVFDDDGRFTGYRGYAREVAPPVA